MTDILGPASDNAVTSRPARTIVRGPSDTWFKDCTDPDAEDGTTFPADFFNDILAQIRTALSSSGITRDGADDMLWRAMRAIGVRYAADSGAANSIVGAFSPPVTPSQLVAGLMLIIKLNASVTGATTITADGNAPAPLKWPDGTALALGDATAGALLLVGFDGTNFQLLCRMNGGGASSANFVPGVIYDWSNETVPSGTLECDGSAVSRATYSRLFGIIGTRYGQGNGTTTFNLPDRRGYFIRGWDHTAGRDPDEGGRTAQNAGGATGNHVGTVQGGAAGPISLTGATAEFVGPGVVYPTDGGASGILTNNANISAVGTVDLTGTLTVSGNSGATETRPKNVTTMFVIAY
jgi:hypothetical protein